MDAKLCRKGGRRGIHAILILVASGLMVPGLGAQVCDATCFLGATIPVHITYFTAWVDENGGLHFQPDIYGYDRAGGN